MPVGRGVRERFVKLFGDRGNLRDANRIFMQQLLYISTMRPTATGSAEMEAILSTSRRNNARDGVTGLLYYDGRRFLQVLEGEASAVTTAFERIRQDPRHRAIVTLSRRTIDAREFGGWAMACEEAGADADATMAQLVRLAANADPSVRETFLGLAGMRRAA